MASYKESYDALLRNIEAGNVSGIARLGGDQGTVSLGGPYSRDAFDNLSEGFSGMLRELQDDVNNGRISKEGAEEYLEARIAATRKAFVENTDTTFTGNIPDGPNKGQMMYHPEEEAMRMMKASAGQAERQVPGSGLLHSLSESRPYRVGSRVLGGNLSLDDLLKIGKSGLKTGARGALGVAGAIGGEILMPVDLGAADIEDPRYMSPDDPRRIRAERDVAGAEFLAEQPGFGGTAPWAGQEPRPRDPAAYETQDFNLPRDIADQLAPPVTEYPEEEQLMAAAEELDATKEEAFASMAPIGDFSKDALNSLVDALNKALPLFGAPEDYATFAEDIEGSLPTEFVRYLAMTSQAANDANLGRLAVDLENIGTDSDLMKAAGQLDVLAENDSFRTFMASADQETEAPVEEVVEEEVQVQTPISDTEVEAMFVERAR